MTEDTFQSYAIDRLARSGIHASTSFMQFVHDVGCLKRLRLSLKNIDRQFLMLCIGVPEYFWIISMNDLDDRREITISTIRSKTAKFFELPHDLKSSAFTPVPDGYYTEHESTQWLDKQNM